MEFVDISGHIDKQFAISSKQENNQMRDLVIKKKNECRRYLLRAEVNMKNI